MKLIHMVLLCLIVIAAMTVWICLTPAGALASGAPHPDVKHMSIGGDGSRAAAIMLPAFIWQATAIILAHCLLMFAFPEDRRKGRARFWIMMSCGLCLAVWTALMLSYKNTLATGDPHMVFGFPLPSTLMIYISWLAQAGLTAIYFFGFHKFIFTPEDEAKFKAILDDKAARDMDAEAK